MIISFNLFLSFSQKSFGRTDSIIFSQQIRGKAVGGFIFEDMWMRNYTIGSEFKFKETVSLGLDFVHFRYRFENEIYDSLGNMQYFEPNTYDTRNYLLIDFKYYPFFKHLKNDRLKPYANAYTKFGKKKIYSQDEVPFKDGDLFQENTSFYDLGFSLGIQVGNRFGGDFSIGMARKFQNKDEVFYAESGSHFSTYGVLKQSWVPNIRANMFFYLYALKKKK